MTWLHIFLRTSIDLLVFSRSIQTTAQHQPHRPVMGKIINTRICRRILEGYGLEAASISMRLYMTNFCILCYFVCFLNFFITFKTGLLRCNFAKFYHFNYSINKYITILFIFPASAIFMVLQPSQLQFNLDIEREFALGIRKFPVNHQKRVYMPLIKSLRLWKSYNWFFRCIITIGENKH